MKSYQKRFWMLDAEYQAITRLKAKKRSHTLWGTAAIMGMLTTLQLGSWLAAAVIGLMIAAAMYFDRKAKC